MDARRATLFVVALAAALAVPAAAAPDALSAIDACTEKLPDFDRVAARCPQLLRALQTSAWATWLPPGWQDQYEDLSARGLASLHMVVARELALQPSARAPQVALLRPILADLAARNVQPRTWWERLRNALRGLIAPEQTRQSRWYERFGHAKPSQALIRAVACVTLALVLALAAWIVVSEWRATRAPRRRVAGADSKRALACAPPEGPSWQDVERAPPEEWPRVLLELIVARLSAARRLPASRALTVRQLAQAAELTDVADRDRLDEVAFTAEQLRFAMQPPSAARLARTLARGRELLENLGEPLAKPGSLRGRA